MYSILNNVNKYLWFSSVIPSSSWFSLLLISEKTRFLRRRQRSKLYQWRRTGPELRESAASGLWCAGATCGSVK